MGDAMQEAIRAMVREIVREEVSALVSTPDPAELIPHDKWPCSSRRRACELARAGRINAELRGRIWYARRGDLDAYMAPEKRPAKADADPSFDDLVAEVLRPRKRGRAA